jgi:transcriptional regulator of acetoin/glycerol metabolism
MKQTRALVCRAAGSPLRPTHLEREYVIGLASSGLVRGIEVYVLDHATLDALVKTLPEGIVHDRGTKHPSKSLGDYLARRGGVQRVRADYHLPGQATRGIRTLLTAAARRHVSGRFFVSMPAAVFEALWERHEHQADEPRDPEADGDGRRSTLQELIALRPDLEIPELVRRSYIGQAPVVRLVHYLTVLAAHCPDPVLIQGETGTGKEIVARNIHALQFGADGKCVSVNCGGIPSELLESELFGHVRGSFTGATRDKVGLWQDAQNGTLFLDEIGDLTPAHQVKVLRAIEERAFLPVGGVRPFKSNARVLAATHRDLESLVRAGRFRADLYHRLVVIRIRTPALREHPEDIPAIARHLWARIRNHPRQALPDEVVAVLQEQPLSGNVRELRSILSGIGMISDGRPLSARLARFVIRERGTIGQDT